MSDILDRVKAHSSPTERRHMDVPEWGNAGVPLRIFWSMVTLADIEQARKVAPTDPLRQQVEILCMKAQDEAGISLFRRIDALELMEVADPLVIIRIGDRMIGQVTPESAAKN